MRRRALLYGGAAASAGIAGAGVAWWRGRPERPGAPLSDGARTVGVDPFWNLAFDTPDGANLPISSFRGKPLLVNFWATWCPPCIEELPLLDGFYKANRPRWQVLGLAVDQPSAVRKWLVTRPLGFSIAMAGLSGTELSKSLGNTSGSLPFTVVFHPSGELAHRKTGKVSPDDLALWSA